MVCLFLGQGECRSLVSPAEAVEFRSSMAAINPSSLVWQDLLQELKELNEFWLLFLTVSFQFLPFALVNCQLLPPSLPSLKQCSSQSSSLSLLVLSQLSTLRITQKLTLFGFLVVSHPILPSDAVGAVSSTFRNRVYLINFTLSGPKQQALQHPWTVQQRIRSLLQQGHLRRGSGC